MALWPNSMEHELLVEQESRLHRGHIKKKKSIDYEGLGLEGFAVVIHTQSCMKDSGVCAPLSIVCLLFVFATTRESCTRWCALNVHFSIATAVWGVQMCKRNAQA
jgi:hypothetical protein